MDDREEERALRAIAMVRAIEARPRDDARYNELLNEARVADDVEATIVHVASVGALMVAAFRMNSPRDPYEFLELGVLKHYRSEG